MTHMTRNQLFSRAARENVARGIDRFVRDGSGPYIVDVVTRDTDKSSVIMLDTQERDVAGRYVMARVNITLTVEPGRHSGEFLVRIDTELKSRHNTNDRHTANASYRGVPARDYTDSGSRTVQLSADIIPRYYPSEFATHNELFESMARVAQSLSLSTAQAVWKSVKELVGEFEAQPEGTHL